MKSKQEIKDWLLENAVNEYGNVDLSNIDFGDMTVMFNGVKATYIDNNSQEATKIHNSSQEASYINNYSQEATNIDNSSQEASYIDNSSQEASYIDNSSQEATDIDNNSQEATDIYNNSQEATRIYNKTNAIIDGKEYKVDLTDNYYLMIEKSTTRNGITIIKGFDRDNTKIWLYKNDYVGYHAETKEQAKEGFKRKLKGFEKNVELINKIKEQGKITREDYHKLTGACDMGINDFARRIGLPNRDYLTLAELKEHLTEHDYGYNMIMKWLEVE